MSGFSRKINREASLRSGLYQEVRLVMAFIEQQEYQVNRFRDEFPSKLQTGGNGIVIDEMSEVVSVSNIGCHEYDLETTFTQDLPNYIRKSQVVMLWAMLEDTLSFIVKELSKEKNIQFRPKKKRESYFIYYIKWFNEIYDIDLTNDSSVCFLNDNVRKVRNSIAHGAELKVEHDGLSYSALGIQVSDSYVWEVCMSMNDLAGRL